VRLLVMDARAEEGESPESVDNAGLMALVDRLLGKWGQGEEIPAGTRLEKTRVVNDSGEWLGFNYYLVMGEALSLQLRTEVEAREPNKKS